MRVNEVAKMLGGSVAIYVIMAACSGGGGPQVVMSSGVTASGSVAASGAQTSSGLAVDGSQGDATPGSGAAADAARSGSGGIVDALTDPVSNAMADSNQSGTRLKIKYYLGADGSKAFKGFYDSQLNVDCYFAKAADGTVRCIPVATATTTTANYYADANCTQPVALVSQCPGTVTPTQVLAQIGTYGAIHTFALGAVAANVSSVYTFVPASSPGACGAVAGFTWTCTPYPYASSTQMQQAAAWTNVQTNATAYTAGAEITPTSPTMFVQAMEQTGP
jgi:hypothetical protein